MRSRSPRKARLSWSKSWGKLGATALALGSLTLVLVLTTHGCVETAECDETVACEGETVCYDYVCLPGCGEQSPCAEVDESCLPCEEEVPRGRINHCRESEARKLACVPPAS